MTLVTFAPTRFGEWDVQVSYHQEKELFLAVACNWHSHDVIIRTFRSETGVIKFIQFLGDNNEHPTF